MASVKSQGQTLAPSPELEKIQSAYTVGQGPDMIRLLSIRTAENSAGFLLPHIKPDSKILDVGCGPGNITVDFGALAPEGSVTGVDASVDALTVAREHVEKRGVKNVKFLAVDASKLPFDDNTFDVAYSHQILVHAPNPVTIMSEIRRVLKPGGVYGSREADIYDPTISPENPTIREAYRRVGLLFASNGANPEAGKVNGDWAVQAGFAEEKITKSTGVLAYMDGWKRWSLEGGSKMARELVDRKIATKEELDVFAQAWKEFEETEGTQFGLKCGEIVCVK